MQISEWIYLEAEDVDTPGGTRYGEDVFVGAVPWYHSYGMTTTFLMATWFAGKLVCVPDPRSGKPPMTDLLR
jgi:long-chain acyl-CoA synthetase